MNHVVAVAISVSLGIASLAALSVPHVWPPVPPQRPSAEDPIPSAASLIAAAVEPHEALREAPVTEVIVQPTVEPTPVFVPTVVPTRVVTSVPTVVRTATLQPTPQRTSVPTVASAQGVPPTGNVANVVARYFPEQPDKAYRVVVCESGANPNINTGNGFYGMWQFDLTTWHGIGGTGTPSSASAEEQTMRARALYNIRGWAPWPNCGRL